MKFLIFSLVLLAASIVWFGYMDMPFNTLPIVLILFGTGWWVRGHTE